MSDTPVIYENPEHPLPEWACWMVKFPAGFCSVFEIRPHIAWPPAVVATGQTWRASGRFGNFDSYTIFGHWRDSLRRVIRLTDPAYYVPENPHTDSEGFLPHVGGKIPKWLWGKRVEVRDTDGNNYIIPEIMECHAWSDSTLAYRIVSKKDSAPKNRSIRVESTPGAEHPDWVRDTFVGAPRSPSDATYPREAVQRAYEHGLRDGRASQSGEPPSRLPSQEEVEEQMFQQEQRYHRNEIAARTLTPVPGMDEWMHDVLREARRHVYAKSVLAEMIATEMTDRAVESATITADAMIEREDSE